LTELRERVAPILANNLLPHFTDHTVAHSDSLAKYADDLVEPLQASDQSLTEDELFIVYSACYLHDVGMQYERAGETNIIASLHLPQQWEELSEDDRRKLLRQHHAAISAEMVMQSVRAETPVVGLQLTTDHYYPKYVARLCEAHTIDTETPLYKELTSGAPNIRMELLSGLLRIADILDLSRRRANRSKAVTLRLDLEAQTHWWRHYYTEDITIDQTQKLVSVWFDFPKDHIAEYRRVVPQLQMPWIEAEFDRQVPVFHRYGFGWSITSVIKEGRYSDVEIMPEAVMAEMLKQLYRNLKREEELHHHIVMGLFEEAQPHIDRRISELESRKSEMSAGDYLREMSRLATDIYELGAIRTAQKLLGSAFEKGMEELTAVERLELSMQLATIRGEEDAWGALGALRNLVPLAEELPDSHPKKLSFWKSWAKSLADMGAYNEAKEAYERAIALASDEGEKSVLQAQVSEMHLLWGKLDEALTISPDMEMRS
jgi:tetratricopeptide (TPR) repeat protein